MKKLGWWLLLTALFVVMASGAGAECKHENVENRKEYYYSPDYIYEYQFDEHYHISVWYKGVECQDCGEFVDIEVGRKEERHEWARMNDGVYCIDCKANKKNEVIICKYCGYDFLCWEGVYNGIPISATHHITMWESQFRCMRCEKTSAVWYGSLGYDSDYPEPHEFIENGDENGYCYWCGYYSAPDPLTVTLYPWDREVCVGEYIAATASVVGGSGEYSFQWYASSDTGLSVSGLEGITTKSACTWTFECTVKDTKTGQTVVAKSAPIKVVEHEWERVETALTYMPCSDAPNYHYVSEAEVYEKCEQCGLPKADSQRIVKYTEGNFGLAYGKHEFVSWTVYHECKSCGYQQKLEDRYHNALLACYDSSEDPMKNQQVRSALTQFYRAADIPDGKIEAILECLENAPEVYKWTYLLSLRNYRLANVSSDGAVFSEKNMELRMGFDKLRFDGTFVDLFFHESAHGIDASSRIDNFFGNSKLAIEIVNAMEDDVEEYVKYSLQGTTQGRYLTGGVPPVRFSM